MTKIIFQISSITLLFLSNLGQAQDFHGQAVYETKVQMNDFKFTKQEMPEAVQAQLQEKMRKAFEKTFVLNFNKFESIYFQEEKLEAPSPSSGGFKMMSAAEGKQYKNVKEKIAISEEDLFGKEFLVQDSLPKWEWKLENETKKIGNYTCHKATILIPVSEEDLKDFEESKKIQANSKTTFIQIQEPKEKIITAWYTPEIPVSQGPDEYWGLPGLILEVNDGKKMALCSKIILNPKEKAEIKRPKKGKKVNQKEFEEITKKQLESMKDGNGVIHINASGR